MYQMLNRIQGVKDKQNQMICFRDPKVLPVVCR
jgi:hypothetical protein